MCRTFTFTLIHCLASSSLCCGILRLLAGDIWYETWIPYVYLQVQILLEIVCVGFIFDWFYSFIFSRVDRDTWRHSWDCRCLTSAWVAWRLSATSRMSLTSSVGSLHRFIWFFQFRLFRYRLFNMGVLNGEFLPSAEYLEVNCGLSK